MAAADTAPIRAVVAGGSMAGLLAVRALSEQCEHVTLVERDPMPDTAGARKGQPQARHPHAILAKGLDHITQAFPDLMDTFREGGALVVDAATTMRWYAHGGYRLAFEVGFLGAIMSRPYLECLVRARVRDLPNVTILDSCAIEGITIAADEAHIAGVRITDRRDGSEREIHADLVVDAMGRGSPTPRWLEHMGYQVPRDEHVHVDLGYATRHYRRDPTEAHADRWYFISPTPPHQKRGGVAFPIEGDRWLVMLNGVAGDHPPDDDDGFLEFARSLPAKDVHDLISARAPLSDIVLHKFPSSRRRHYQEVERMPAGLVVVGDALASFNPIYGQGMTSAALQAALLAKVIASGGTRTAIASTYFSEAAKVVDGMWQMAVGEDFRYPETRGPKPRGTDIVNAYVSRVHRATHDDPVVAHAFLRVMHMLAPPSTLFHPRILAHVLRPRSAKRVRPSHAGPHG